MGCMQTNQRVIGCPEQVRGNGQIFFIDKPVPFLTRAEQKQPANNECQKPQDSEDALLAALQKFGGQVYGYAAGQKADGIKHRRFKDLARGWSTEALPCIEEIGHHEDRKDGGLGDDERGHSDLAAIGKNPGSRGLSDWNCAHFGNSLLVSAVRIFRMFQIPQRAPACDYRNSSEVVGRGLRGYRPFESPCIPWIVSGPGSLPIRNDEVVE